MRRLLAIALGLCLWAAPALAGISNIAGSGTGGALTGINFSSTSPINETTTAAVGPQNLVIVIVQNFATSPTLGCSDAYGNTWQAATGGAFTTNTATQIWYTVTKATIPNSGTITCTTTINGGGITAQVMAFTGVNTGAAFDTNATADIGSGTSTTVGPSPTLACPASGTGCDVCITGILWNSSGTVTLDGTWTSTTPTLTSTGWLTGYKIVSANTALSYIGSTTATGNFAGSMACFKAQGFNNGLTSLGVGH